MPRTIVSETASAHVFCVRENATSTAPISTASKRDTATPNEAGFNPQVPRSDAPPARSSSSDPTPSLSSARACRFLTVEALTPIFPAASEEESPSKRRCNASDSRGERTPVSDEAGSPPSPFAAPRRCERQETASKEPASARSKAGTAALQTRARPSSWNSAHRAQAAKRPEHIPRTIVRGRALSTVTKTAQAKLGTRARAEAKGIPAARGQSPRAASRLPRERDSAKRRPSGPENEAAIRIMVQLGRKRPATPSIPAAARAQTSTQQADAGEAARASVPPSHAI